MSVSVNRKALEDFIKRALFERDDIRYGTFDRPLTSEEGNEPGFESTVPSEVPVAPVKMMATQLADDRPPVEDEDFIPANSTELGRAANVIANMVPDSQIEKFYLELHRLLDAVTADENDPGDIESSAMDIPIDAKESVQEEAIRRAVRSMIFESNWDAPRYADEDNEYEWDPGDDPVPVNNEPDGMDWDDIAEKEGHTGRKWRQSTQRALARSNYVIDQMPPGDIEKLQDFAVAEFIDTMLAGGYIDEEDAVELQQSPDIVKGLDSFRQLLRDEFISNPYNKIKKPIEDAIRAEIDKIPGLPQKSKQTVLNQALGETTKSKEKLANKITKDFNEEFKKNKDASKWDQDPLEEVEKIIKAVNAKMPTLVKLSSSKLSTDLLDVSKDRWNKLSKGRKQTILSNTLKTVAKFQAGQKDDEKEVDWDAWEKSGKDK